jgi:hypothetical protein
MKVKILVSSVLIIGVALIFLFAQKGNPVEVVGNNASINFELTSFDFGEIKEANGKVEHTFKFSNNGTSALLVKDVKTSCGCTSPDWTRKPVEPGENGFIKVEYDPKKRPGTFHKSLAVVSNANSQQIRLHIKGNVEPIPRPVEEDYPTLMGGLRVKYDIISFEVLTKEKPVSEKFKVYNHTDTDISFMNEYKAPDHIKVNFTPQSLPPHSTGTIEIIYDPRELELLGHKTDFVEINTDEQFNSLKKFRIIAALEEYFPSMTTQEMAMAPRLKIENNTHDFGRIKKGESVTTEFVITNTGNGELNIRQTRASCGCTASKPKKSNLKPGESSTIKVTFNSAGRSGVQNKTIFVFTNDPSNPTQKLLIKGTVAS